MQTAKGGTVITTSSECPEAVLSTLLALVQSDLLANLQGRRSFSPCPTGEKAEGDGEGNGRGHLASQ